MLHGSVVSNFWASAILMEAHYARKRVSNDTTSCRQCDITVHTDYRLGGDLISLLL